MDDYKGDYFKFIFNFYFFLKNCVVYWLFCKLYVSYLIFSDNVYVVFVKIFIVCFEIDFMILIKFLYFF